MASLQPSGTYRLLTLPYELRHHIFSYILISPAPIQISSRSPGHQTATVHYDRAVEPLFLSVCKQTRREGLPIFYGHNIFFSALEEAIVTFLARIGPEKREMLRSVRGFGCSTYFDYHWAKRFLEEVEGRLCSLRQGVMSVPFGHDEFPGMIFWLRGGSNFISASREGIVERGEGVFKVEEDGKNVVLKPARLIRDV